MWKNPLEKWTTEFLAATAIGFALWVVPMTWEMRCLGAVLLWILIADLIRRTSWTKSVKFSLDSVSAITLGLLIYPTVKADYKASMPLQSLSQDNQAKDTKESLDYKISLFCQLMMPPKTLDGNTNGNVEVYILQKATDDNDAVAEVGMPAGSLAPVLLGESKQSAFFSKCSITNYSDTSLIGVYTTLWVSFCPFKKTKTAWVSQNPIALRQINTPPLNIPPATSPNNSQFFYIVNATSYLAQITTPTEVAFVSAETTNEQTAKLIPPTEPSTPGIWPGLPLTTPPAESPQAPAQQ